MSLVDAYLNQEAQLKSLLPFVFYNGPALETLPLEINDIGGDGFKLKVTTSAGAACTGSVMITGFIDSTPRSETITFSDCRSKTSVYTYTEITSITTTGLHDEDPVPNIYIVAVDAGGALITETVWSDFWCRWEEKSVSYWNDLGDLTLSDAKVMCTEIVEPADWIRKKSVGGVGFEVVKVIPATELGGEEEFRTLLL